MVNGQGEGRFTLEQSENSASEVLRNITRGVLKSVRKSDELLG